MSVARLRSGYGKSGPCYTLVVMFEFPTSRRTSNRSRPPASLVVACILLLWGSAAVCAAPGGRIAFAIDSSPESRTSRVYTAEPDGSAAVPVSSGSARDRAPAFSPDGKWLAFQSTDELGLSVVMVAPSLPVEGPEGGARTLTHGLHPQWSLDGQRILFSRRNANDYQLYVIRADGSQKEADLKPIARGQIGRWSPDEKQLAAVAPAIVDGQDRWQLQIVSTESFESRMRITLPDSYGQAVSLEWAPGGHHLLFTTTRGPHYEMRAIDLREPVLRKVPTDDTVPNPAYGSWSPDGQQILFRSASEPDSAGVTVSKLCVMNADGTDVRTLWEPENRAMRIHGTAWYRPAPVTMPAAAPPPQPAPAPKPVIPPAAPPAAPPPRVLGPVRTAQAARVFSLPQERSPVTVPLVAPGAADWVITVPVLPDRRSATRRKGVGVTLELEDGSLYRGTVIHSGVPWATLQGRPRAGKVRLIDGKKLAAGAGDFKTGFRLTLRREGKKLVIAVNDQDVLARPVLASAVRSLTLTLENFDPGSARFSLGPIQYRPWETPPAGPPP